VKSIISSKSVKIESLCDSHWHQVQLFFGGPGRNGFTAARIPLWNTWDRCILWWL